MYINSLLDAFFGENESVFYTAVVCMKIDIDIFMLYEKVTVHSSLDSIHFIISTSEAS